MTDLERIEARVRRVSARARVLLVDEGPLVVASVLAAAGDAMALVRRSLAGAATDSAERRAVLALQDELSAIVAWLASKGLIPGAAPALAPVALAS